MSEDGAVSIRRRPPQGPNKHELGVGQFEFLIEKVDENGERVDNVENRPRNILEEIVWYKDVELAERKEKFPLQLVRTALVNAPPTRDFVQALKDQLAETKQLRAAMAVPQPGGWQIVYPLPAPLLPSRAGPKKLCASGNLRPDLMTLKAPIAKCARQRGPFAMRKIGYSVGGGPRAPVSVRSVVVK